MKVRCDCETCLCARSCGCFRGHVEPYWCPDHGRHAVRALNPNVALCPTDGCDRWWTRTDQEGYDVAK